MNALVRACIIAYQKILSPDKRFFMKKAPVCKFLPSCSEYGLEAFRRFGFFRAAFYTGKRILRCHPFAKGGYDPLKIQIPKS